MIVLWEPCKTYPPIPNIPLPMSMTQKIDYNPPQEQISCPITQKIQVAIKITLAPSLSIRGPPIRGMITLGKE